MCARIENISHPSSRFDRGFYWAVNFLKVLEFDYTSLTRFRGMLGRRQSLRALSMIVALTLANPIPAFAHGEKSQPLSLRMLALTWYDVACSEPPIAVNQEAVLSGKIHVLSALQQAVSRPIVTSLRLKEAGPVLVPAAQFIGDQSAAGVVSLVPGQDYTFSLNLRARRAGRWHIHPEMDIEGSGPVIGPGCWIEVKGGKKDFTDPVTLLDGLTIDLEHYGISQVYAWHVPWLIVGAAWILFWFVRKGILLSYLRVAEGKDDDAITDEDRRIGATVMALTILATIFGYAYMNSEFPRTIPLQAGLQKPLTPLTPITTRGTAGVGTEQVSVDLGKGVYKVSEHELTMNVNVTNSTPYPLLLGEYTTSGLRFLNPDVFTTKPESPDYLLADRGLSTDPTPIAPGETKDIVVKLQDARWDIERLSDPPYDMDSQIGGLLFFFTPNGQRFAAEIAGPVSSNSGVANAAEGDQSFIPVYNVVAKPNAGAPDILIDGASTQLSFSIGPDLPGRIPLKRNIAPEKLAQLNYSNQSEITVTMTCYVCKNPHPQTKKIIYVSESLSSNTATFLIIPSHQMATGGSPNAITFDLERNGVQFDFINIPIRIIQNHGFESLQPSESKRTMTACVPSSFEGDDPASDLIIRLRQASTEDDTIEVGFEAPNNELARQLGTLINDQTGPRYFATGAHGKDALAKQSASAFAELLALVKRNKIDRLDANKDSLSPNSPYYFNERSQKVAFDHLYQIGFAMYDTLFYSDNEDSDALRQVMRVIEHYGEDNASAKAYLRIEIHTNGIYYPWQLLYPEKNHGMVHFEKFWGMKYIIGVLPAHPRERNYCGKLPSEIAVPREGGLLYAGYNQLYGGFEQNQGKTDAIISSATSMNSATSFDQVGKGLNDEELEVTRLAEIFENKLKASFGTSIKVIHDKKSFMDALELEGRDVPIRSALQNG